MKHDSNDFEALTRLLLGEVDAKERASLEAWIDRDDAARAHYEELRAATDLLRTVSLAPADATLSDARREQILAVAGGAAAVPATGVSSNVTAMTRIAAPPRTPSGWISSSLAAAILLVAVLAVCVSMPEPTGDPAVEVAHLSEVSAERTDAAAGSELFLGSFTTEWSELPEELRSRFEERLKQLWFGEQTQSFTPEQLERHLARLASTEPDASVLDEFQRAADFHGRAAPGAEVPTSGGRSVMLESALRIAGDPKAPADRPSMRLEMVSEPTVHYLRQAGESAVTTGVGGGGGGVTPQLKAAFDSATAAAVSAVPGSKVTDQYAYSLSANLPHDEAGTLLLAGLAADGQNDPVTFVQLDGTIRSLEEVIAVDRLHLDLGQAANEHSAAMVTRNRAALDLSPALSPEAAAHLRHPQIAGEVFEMRDERVVLDAGVPQDLTVGATVAITANGRSIGTAKVESFEKGRAVAHFTPTTAGASLPTRGLAFVPVADGLAQAFAEERDALRAEAAQEVERVRIATEEALRAQLASQARDLVESFIWSPEERPEQFFARVWGDQPFIDASLDPLSTFGIDVDTASYSFARNHLLAGRLPPPESVRTEEFVNAMPRRLPSPTSGDLGLHMELATSELAHRDGVFLLEVGVKAREVTHADRKPVALTVVLDVSGSMKRENRLGIVKTSLLALLDSLDARDTIGIISFADAAQVVLEPVPATSEAAVIAAFDGLVADGSTNVSDGLVQGYAMAQRQYREGASNRVLLFSDGIANTGQTEVQQMLEATAGARAKQIDCNTFGVGMQNHDDHLMEQLANRGNGVNAYIDDQLEAERLFGRDFTSTFETVARDAKIQVEFHPGVVAHYRQVGYENRAIADADFRNDAVDAGEVGAGHQVVALYEVELHPFGRGPLATARVRYESAETGAVVEIEDTVNSSEIVNFFAASDGFRLSACAASFAEVLRDSTWARNSTIGEIFEVATPLIALDTPDDPSVAEFVDLMAIAQPLEEARAKSAIDAIIDRLRDLEHRRAQLETRRVELEGMSGGTSDERVRRSRELDSVTTQIEKLLDARDALEGEIEVILAGR